MGFLLIPLVGLLVPALATLDESKLKDLSELANIKSAGDALEPSSRNGRLFYISYTSSTTTISTEVALSYMLFVVLFDCFIPSRYAS